MRIMLKAFLLILGSNFLIHKTHPFPHNAKTFPIAFQLFFSPSHFRPQKRPKRKKCYNKKEERKEKGKEKIGNPVPEKEKWELSSQKRKKKNYKRLSTTRG